MEEQCRQIAEHLVIVALVRARSFPPAMQKFACRALKLDAFPSQRERRLAPGST
jgi:hypothetical protein